MDPSLRTWFFDQLSPSLAMVHGLKQVLYKGQTAFQSVEVLDTTSYGRCLVLDGKPQSSEVDEFIYHEALVHPALITHPDPRRVLVAGGGEGATLREVLAHNTVRSVEMVDLDAQVVDLCKRYLPEWNRGVYEDKRATVVFADAKAHLEAATQPYDVIVSDITDPLEAGPAFPLFTREFYGMVKDRLSPDGLIVVQAGFSNIPLIHVFPAIHNTLKQVFPIVAGYHTLVPSFGGTWGFVIASKKHDPHALSASEIDQRIAKRIRAPLRFYDGVTHHGMLALPKMTRQALAAETRVITADQPIFAF
ncbi:MAG: polyamine aminopropyltransferase [Chloroflexi bacterium]|nr:polyamine aminopropyltransferase [Chloroflexota bacterium]